MPDRFIVKRLLTLLFLCYLFFFLGNSLVPLTDPDEVFYSLTTKEMAARNEWFVPYIFNQPQFEKPIFTYWLLRVATDLGGMTPESARFFPAVFASLGVLAVYALGLLGFRNERKAFWSAMVLGTGGLYIGMGKTVFTDMVFTVFILYALLSFYLAYSSPKQKVMGILGFYIFSGLAVLTKGPLGFTVCGLTVVLFLLYQKQIQFIFDKWMFFGFLLCLWIALPWYLFMVDTYGQAFVHEFFYNDHWRRLVEAEHRGNDRWYFYPLTILMGVFPWSLFVGAGLWALYKKLKTGLLGFEYFLLSWLLVVLIVFVPAHSKLASYILPVFPALALLTGSFIVEALNSTQPRLMRNLIAITAAALLCLGVGVLIAYPFYTKYLSSNMPVYFCSAALIAMAALMCSALLRQRLSWALGVLSMVVMAFLLTAFMAKSDVLPYVSSFEAAQYVPHAPGQKTTLLASKPYARGIRYYTGQEIAVLDINGRNYFSPHPIPILNTTEQLVQFLKAQKKTYAVLKKGGYKHVRELPANKFKVSLLKVIGYNYVLTIESI